MYKGVDRGSNTSEIAFIVCTNNKDYMDECRFYIEQLYVPEGMTVSLLAVEGAGSMTSGYNEAMRASDARYKVYLHQDMFIVNRNFIYDILNCFKSDEALGMVGIAGARKLPDNADAWKSLDIGGCYSNGTFVEAGFITVKPDINNPSGCFQEVEFIDGMLMATAYDLDWDERIEGFHFYDVSQSVNFRKCGLKIAVARQEDIWCFHDLGPLNIETYNINRKKFCELYPEFDYEKGDVEDHADLYQMCNTIAEALLPLFDSRQYAGIQGALREVDNAIYFHQDLLTMYFMMEIRTLENLWGMELFMNVPDEDNVYKCLEVRYFNLKRALIRAAFGYESAEYVADMIADRRYSMAAVIVFMLHHIPQESMYLLDEISVSLQKRGFVEADEWEAMVHMVKEYEEKNIPSAKDL